MSQIIQPSKDMHQILFARHGNTFRPNEEPTRVGARTDLPLVETAKAQAIGQFLKTSFQPSQVVSSPLIRTKSTAQIAIDTAGFSPTPIEIDERFREIDYGPDENKTEDLVIQRIGKAAIEAWDQKAVVPAGWLADPKQIQDDLQAFLCEQSTASEASKTLVVTSNGILRFLIPFLSEISLHQAVSGKNLKVKTGNLCLIQKPLESEAPTPWECVFWNAKPCQACEYF